MTCTVFVRLRLLTSEVQSLEHRNRKSYTFYFILHVNLHTYSYYRLVVDVEIVFGAQASGTCFTARCLWLCVWKNVWVNVGTEMWINCYAERQRQCAGVWEMYAKFQ